MTDVHTLQERDGARQASMAVEHQRADASFAVAERKQFDIADLDDAEFERALVRVQVRQVRMAKILDTVLIENVHYGREKDKYGNAVFKKPILKKAGQEELRNLFRFQLVHTAPPIIDQSQDYVSVVCTVAVMDGAGRVLAPHVGGCNSKEKRFLRFDGKGYTYTDARETLNDCLAMAEKRAANRATMEVTGATAFLANEEEMNGALDGEAAAPVAPPWTPEERKAFQALALAKGVKKTAEFAAFVVSVIGERAVLQSDLPALVTALERYRAPGVPPVKAVTFDDDPAAPGALQAP